MTTLITTIPTKKEFTARVRDVHDKVGHSLTVTNKRRSWFASVTVLADRRLKVE